MPGLSRQAADEQEPPLLARSRKDAVGIAAVVALTAGLFAAVAAHGGLVSIQQLDNSWLRLMIPAGRCRSPVSPRSST